MVVVGLALNGAQVSAGRFEEHAGAVASSPENHGLAVRKARRGLEQFGGQAEPVDPELPPLDRGMQRAMERRVHGNIPSRRAAHAFVPAAVWSVEGQDVDGHRNQWTQWTIFP